MEEKSDNISKESFKEEIQESNSKGKTTGDEIQLVVFKLGTEEYGVEIHEVKSIIEMTSITRIPQAPDFVEGIINLRGKIVVVINLLKRFGTFNENEHNGSHIIVSEVDGNSFGIMVDGVSEVLKISKEDTRKAPGIIAAKIHADYLKGIGILNEGKRLLILIDLSRILSEKDMVEMAEMTKSMKLKSQSEDKEKTKKSEKSNITDKQIEEKFKEHFDKSKKPKDTPKVEEKKEETPKEETKPEEKTEETPKEETPKEEKTEETPKEETKPEETPKEETKPEEKTEEPKVEEKAKEKPNDKKNSKLKTPEDSGKKTPKKKQEATSKTKIKKSVFEERMEKEKELLKKEIEKKFEEGGKI